MTRIIYTGKNLFDIQQATGVTAIFEDIFSKDMSSTYQRCWAVWPPERPVICKTMDAIRAAPDEDSEVVCIGRSIRISDKGALVELRMTKSDFMYLEDMELTNKHIAQRAP